MEKIIKFTKNYIAFSLGTVFGAIVASVTSYYVFSILSGDIDALRLLQIEECLIEKIEVVDE